MLNSIYSVQTRKYGVVDVNDNNCFKMVVPLKYNQITLQKYGIVAHNSDGTCDTFLPDGTIICNNAINPLFLADNLLLLTSSAKDCFIIDYIKKKPIMREGAESILFFMGSKPQAIPYSAGKDFSSYLASSDYSEHGAHLEELVALKINNAWGVINRKTGETYVEFNNSIMVQCIEANFAARGFDGIAREF